MNIALLILPDGTYIVSETNQLEYEPRVHLTNPYQVSGSSRLTLKRWPSYTNDTDILLHSEALLTVCEANQSLLDLYVKKVGVTPKELTKTPEPVMLSEDNQEDLLDDEYEPRYIEE